MKVIFVSEFKIYKGNSAGASRILNYARALTLGGNQVYLCSLETPRNIALNHGKEIEHNIFVVGEELLVKKSKLLNKIIIPIKAFLFVLNLYKILNNKYKDIRIIQYPSIHVSLDLWIVILLIKLGDYKVFLEVNEVRKFYIHNKILPKSFLKFSLMKIYLYSKSIKYSLVERLSSNYSGLLCISTNIIKYFSDYNDNCIRIPILISDNKPSESSFKKYKSTDIFLICFSGSIILKKEGFDLFLKALSNLKTYCVNFELHLYGYIRNSEKELILEKLPVKLDIKNNIKYFGEINQEELPDILKGKNLLVLPRPFTMQNHYGFSTKLADYLMSGVPVLVTDVSDNSLYIQDGVNGFIIKPGDIFAMTEKLLYIINNYNTISEIVGQNGYNTAIKNFHYSEYSNVLCEFIK